MLARITALVYGAFSYLVFFATFLYGVGFIGNILVPKSMDSGRVTTVAEAIAVDTALLALFAIQHSVMARQWFKRAWTAVIPPVAERSTYVLFSSLCLALLFWQWRPIGGSIWQVDNTIGRAVLYSLYAGGWVILLISTFLTSHFDLFGVRQVWIRFRNRPYEPVGFRSRGLYKLVRHPLYVGWLFTFWFTPSMTAAHLIFSIATTAYILVAIQFEERDLVAAHGEAYLRYREEVPMLMPKAPLRYSERERLRRSRFCMPLPLIVGHSHSHGDHVAGDSQFRGGATTTIVPLTVARTSEFFKSPHWPDRVGQIDLGIESLM